MKITRRISALLNIAKRDWHMRGRVKRGGALYLQAWEAIKCGDIKTAEETLRLIEMQKNSLSEDELLLIKISIMGLKNENKKAIRLLEDAVNKHKHSLDLRLALAWNYAATGNWKKALKAYSYSLSMEGATKYQCEIESAIADCRDKLKSVVPVCNAPTDLDGEESLKMI